MLAATLFGLVGVWDYFFGINILAEVCKNAEQNAKSPDQYHVIGVIMGAIVTAL